MKTSYHRYRLLIDPHLQKAGSYNLYHPYTALNKSFLTTLQLHSAQLTSKTAIQNAHSMNIYYFHQIKCNSII